MTTRILFTCNQPPDRRYLHDWNTKPKVINLKWSVSKTNPRKVMAKVDSEFAFMAKSLLEVAGVVVVKEQRL